MAVTAVLFLVPLVLSIIGSDASGELWILNRPESLSFSGSSTVPESTLKEIFSAALGLSIEENSDWKGLQITDPFSTPECVVEVYIDGVSSLGEASGLKGHKYPVIVDEYEPDTYESVKHRINQRYTHGGNKLVSLRLSDPNELKSYENVFGIFPVPKVSKKTYSHLKANVEEDYQFLSELAVLKTITEQIKQGRISADNVVDFYNFRFTTLHVLSDFHGPNSLQVKEAKKLMGEALQDMTAAFVKAYDGSVVVAVVTTDVAHTRRAARTRRGAPTAPTGYSSDYAAVFNIILWFTVIFVFTMIAIVYSLVDMDPGRDSIIYRMTNTRLKKDN